MNEFMNLNAAAQNASIPSGTRETIRLTPSGAQISRPSLAHFVRSLFITLEQRQVRNCAMQGWEAVLDRSQKEFAIELAVHPDDRAKLYSAFDLLSKDGYRLVQELNYSARVSALTFAWFENLSLKTIRIDFVFEPPKNRHKAKNLWIADPSLAFACTLLNCIATGAVSPRQERQIDALVEKLGRTGAEGIAGELVGSRLGKQIVEASQAGRLEEVLTKLGPALAWRQFLKKPSQAARFFRGEAGRKILRWKQPTGLSLVLLGPDGVGKSTLVSGMMTSLAPLFSGEHVSHWRPGVVIPIRDGDKSEANPHDDPPRSAFVSTLYLLGFCLDFWVGHAVRIRPQLTQSKFVIFDRYYYDLLVDQVRYRYSGSEWLLRFLLRFIPKREQIVLILDAPENVILSRKQQLTLAELQRQRVAYRGLTKTLNNAHIIETQHGIEQALAAACHVVTEQMGQRIEARHAASFATRPTEISGGSL